MATITLELRDSMLYDSKGTYVAAWGDTNREVEPTVDLLAFIKQGVTPDDLIKLKNADLLK